jgi:hypothetical protein
MSLVDCLQSSRISRWLVLFPFFLVATFAFGTPQSTANKHSLSGTVVDPSSSEVTGADVTVLDASGSVVASTTTNNSGLFFFNNLPHGRYHVKVRASGFRDATSDVSIGPRPLPPLRVVLAILVVNETVSVAEGGSSPQISTETSENQNANTITGDALDRVPVFDQDYISLLSRFLSEDTIGTNGVSLVVNGVEANGPGVSASAVQEVRINQNPYSAQFSRPGRARLEITTKPGTPAFHGTINFLTRNSAVDATNYFAVTKAPESRYCGEGSLSGPLGRDKKNSFLLSLEQDYDNLQSVVRAFGPDNTLIEDNVAAPERHFFGSFRAFHDFSSGDQFWIAYSFESESQRNQGVGGTVLREAGYSTESREHEVNVGYRRIFSPHWVNQLRFLVGHNGAPVISNVQTPQTVVEGYFTGGGAQADSKRTESHVDGTDFLTYAGGRHLLVFGVDVPDISRRGADDFTNSQGTYTFADMGAYNSQQPSAFRIQTGNGHLVFWERTVAGFIEDTVRVRPSLSVSMGLRYYFQNRFHNDGNNLAPRLSFAFAPSAKSHTVFRGGTGFFFDRSGPRPIADLLHFDGNNLLRLLLPLQPGGSVPFPVMPADLANVPASLVVLDPRARIPYVFQYSFGVERQITAKNTLSATYVGNRGIDLFRSVDANAPQPPTYSSRSNPSVGQIRSIQSDGYQKSNSLEITFRGKPTKVFSGQAQYTLSKTYNNTGGVTYFVGNSNFPELDWARSSNDRRHKFDLLGSFEPTNLFSLGVALQAYAGKPVNLITGADANGDGIFNDRSEGGLAPRNSLHGPGYLNLDINLAHDFHLNKEKKNGLTLTTALNVFNVLNHPNFLTFNGVIGQDPSRPIPSFGTPSAAEPGRRFQLNFEFKF